MTVSERLARPVIRFRWAIIVFWVLVAVAGSTLLPNVEQAKTGTLGDLVPSDAKAIETEKRSVELFSFPVLSRTVIVEQGPGDLSPDRVAQVLGRAGQVGLGRLGDVDSIAFALPVTNTALAGTPDKTPQAALTYLFFPQDIGPVGRTGLANRLLERYIAAPGVETGVTGAVPARGEQIDAITDTLPLVELVTILLVAVAVGLHFRSLVAPLVNIVTVGLAYVIAVRLIGGIGSRFGISVPEEVEPVMVALLFGIVTDYLIFFVSRFRGLLADGREPLDAAVETTARLGPIILTAGLSVAAASASLVAARLGFYQAFGPGLALAVLIACAVVLTLVPATLAVLGRWLFWPTGPRPEAAPEEEAANGVTGGGLRARLVAIRSATLRFPLNRPKLAILVSATPLIVLSLMATKLNLANTLISGLPTDSPAKTAYRLVGEDFPAGAISPTMVLVEQPGIALRDRELNRLRKELASRRNVAYVIGPGSVDEEIDLGATVSPQGDAVRYLIILDLDPLGARAINTVERLEGDLPQLLDEAGLNGATATLAGDTAVSVETVRQTSADLDHILPLACLVVLLVLAVFLRALVAPLYLVLASLLALGAALGLTVFVFQYLLGYGELTFYVPFAGIVLLIALGSDYNVYLVGRVWAEAQRRPLREAIAVAAERARTAITVAGLVLALSFAALALVPLRPFHELAFLLSSGLLIDAFIVRSILAPALIALFGNISAWPGPGLRRVEEESS